MLKPHQLDALFEAAHALYQCIPPGAFPTGGIPSGHLYAYVMGSCSLDMYNLLIATLQKANLITVSNHYITRNPKPQA